MRPVVEFYDDKEVLTVDGVHVSYGYFRVIGRIGTPVDNKVIRVTRETVDGQLVFHANENPLEFFTEDEIIDELGRRGRQELIEYWRRSKDARTTRLLANVTDEELDAETARREKEKA